MKKLKFLSVLCSISFFAAFCSAQMKPITASNTTFAADALKSYVESGALPGAISILCKDNVQETACVGWANVEKKTPISLDSTFMQCSQTKGFCGVTIAILVEEGKLSLDDPVHKYLPEFKNLKIAVKGKDGQTTTVHEPYRRISF